MKEYLVYDSVAFSTRKILDNGFMLATGRASKPGIYQYTPESIGMVSEKGILNFYRPPQAVFDSNSIESFRYKPVTDGHNCFIYADNSQKYIKGICEDVYRDKDDKTQEEYIGVKLLITDKEMIEEIENGKKELSAGHSCRFTMEEGRTPEGEAYDGIQDCIKVNHIGIVELGRAGRDCLIFDSQENKNINNKETQNSEGKIVMTKVSIKGKLFEVSDEAVEAIEQLKKESEENEKKAKDQEPQIEDLKKELEELNAKRDELQAKIDSLSGENKNLEDKLTPDSLDKVVEERLAVISKAKALDSAFDSNGKSIGVIKREIVKSSCNDINDINKKSDEYINARFDALTINGKSAIDRAIESNFTTVANDDKDIVAEKRALMMAKNRDAYKQK